MTPGIATATAPRKPNMAVQDYNPGEAASRNAPPESKDHIGHINTATEETLRLGLDVISEHADRIRAQCEERDRKDGTRFWMCPLCTAEQRSKQENKGRYVKKVACSGHINSAHKSTIAVMKHEGKDKRTWAPIEKIQSPKRRLEDMMTPEQLRFRAGAVQSVEQVKQATSGGSRELTAAKLIGQPESLAALKLVKLDNDELKHLAHMAWARGRKQLTRAARKECTKRSIALNF